MSRIYALFGTLFTGLKNMVAYEKLQISDMAGMISVDGVVESVGGGGSQVPRPTWEVSRGT